jgi:hypothetical protein
MVFLFRVDDLNQIVWLLPYLDGKGYAQMCRAVGAVVDGEPMHIELLVSDLIFLLQFLLCIYSLYLFLTISIIIIIISLMLILTSSNSICFWFTNRMRCAGS